MTGIQLRIRFFGPVAVPVNPDTGAGPVGSGPDTGSGGTPNWTNATLITASSAMDSDCPNRYFRTALSAVVGSYPLAINQLVTRTRHFSLVSGSAVAGGGGFTTSKPLPPAPVPPSVSCTGVLA